MTTVHIDPAQFNPFMLMLFAILVMLFAISLAIRSRR